MNVGGILIILSLICLQGTSNGQSLERPPLLAITESTIYLVDETTWEKHALYRRRHINMRFISVDFHHEKEMVFAGFIEYERGLGNRGKIMSGKIKNGRLTETKTLMTTGYNPAVTVDWLNNKLYWKCLNEKIGFKGSIHVSNLDGSESHVLHNIQITDRISKFQLDPVNRWIYFISKTSDFKDVLQRIDIGNTGSPQIIASCADEGQSIHCSYDFAVDNAANGTIYWMDKFGSLVKSVSSNGGNPQSYDFGSYEFSLESPGGYSFTTIDVPFNVAHKGSLYGNPWYRRYEKIGVIARMIPGITAINYLPSLGMEKYRIFHSSAQPVPYLQ